MIIEKHGHYLDSDGRRFVCNGFGDKTGLALGWAYDPRPKQPRKLAAGYDDFSDRVGGLPTSLICPYPANDWYPVAFCSFERGAVQVGVSSTCGLCGLFVKSYGGAA
jgi:hypothetical protein